MNSLSYSSLLIITHHGESAVFSMLLCLTSCGKNVAEYLSRCVTIPASSYVCKIIAFSGIIAGGIFVLPPNRFCIFLMLHVFAGFETAEKPNETAQNPDETAKKIKSPKCGN
jgi:hypothetical protein